MSEKLRVQEKFNRELQVHCLRGWEGREVGVLYMNVKFLAQEINSMLLKNCRKRTRGLRSEESVRGLRGKMKTEKKDDDWKIFGGRLAW